MTATLTDFGYGLMKVGGAAAAGERPLLLVMANLLGVNGEFAHGEQHYREQLFGSSFGFNQDGPVYIRNVRDYYSEMSCGRFTWKSTQPASVGPLTLSSTDAALPLGQRRPRILELARDQEHFNFAAYDTSSDGVITSGELGVSIIDNGSNSGAQTGSSTGLAVVAGRLGSGSIGVSVCGQRSSLTRVAHELSHQLGTVDIYGPWDLNLNLSGGCSLMSGSEGDDGTMVVHLDPWHKMRLGWAEPRIVDVTQGASTLDLVAPGAQDPKGAAILYSPQKGTSEFFIIEFRNPAQSSGRYDRNVNSRGLAIWHVVTNAAFDVLEYAWGGDATRKARMLWTEGRPTSSRANFGLPGTDFERGGSVLWDRGSLTPPLLWADGTPVGVRLRIRDFAAIADSATVDVVPAALRRQTSSGRMIQSTFGRTGNYELLVSAGSSLAHFWRDNDKPNWPWHRGAVIPLSGAATPSQAAILRKVLGASLVQTTLGANGSTGDFEAAIWMNSFDLGSHLELITVDATHMSWSSPRPITVSGQAIDNVTGTPAMVRSDMGSYGDDQMLVPQGNKVVHYRRQNDAPGRPWSVVASIAFTGGTSWGQVQGLAQKPEGVAMLQSSIRGNGTNGNLEAVAFVRNSLGQTHLSWFTFDTATQQWTTPRNLTPAGSNPIGATSTPAIIQSDYGSVGNYEMLVPEGKALVHYWRNNDDPKTPWTRGHAYTFGGSSSTGQASAVQEPVAVSMLKSSIKGDSVHGNFDAVVRLHSALEQEDRLVFIAFDSATRTWTSSQPIAADGQAVREK